MTEKTKRMTLSVEETAAELGVSVRTVYNLVHQSGFPTLRLGGRIRVSTEGLRQWIRQQMPAGLLREEGG